MPVENEILKGAREARIKEIDETFEYAKNIALDAMENKKVLGMTFTLYFETECVSKVSYDITEAYY